MDSLGMTGKLVMICENFIAPFAAYVSNSYILVGLSRLDDWREKILSGVILIFKVDGARRGALKYIVYIGRFAARERLPV